jgi:two-component system CheB/CheR fusion protein
MLPLRAVINKAKKESKPARQENIRIAQDGGTLAVNVEVIPLKNLRERCYLILFEPAKEVDRVSGPPAHEQPSEPARTSRSESQKNESRRVIALEHELAEMSDYLQSVLEQHGAANEELQASNEEVQSANEELQSINEELETSKEELESANEELTTVNDEMANRNTELNRLNSDLGNLQTSTKLAILLLGRDLTIRRFSAQAEKQFNLLAADIGRPISRVRHNLDLADLDAIVDEVVANVHETERQVRDKDGHWYLLRVRPYLTIDNKVDGAVLVLVNIDDLKRVEQAITEGRDYADAVIRTAPDPLVVLTADLRIQSANEAFYGNFRLSPAEADGRSLFELNHGSWDDPKLRKLLDDIIPRNGFFNDFEITRDFERIGRRTLLLNARSLIQAEGKTKLVLLGIRDMTEVLAFRAELQRSELRYRRLFETARDGVLIVDFGSRKITDANPYITQLLGYAREELLGKELWEIGVLKDEQSSKAAFEELQQKRQIRYEDLPLHGRSGDRHEVEVVANRYDEDGASVIQCNIREITERKRGEERQQLLTNELAHRGKNLLAVIQTIASRSLSGTRSLAEAREAFLQRIQALARSQTMLVDGGFQGAPVSELIRLEFEAFSDRIKAVGPAVMLSPKAAQTFALLVHELATNAIKYGALSQPGGRITIDWSTEDGETETRFKFRWQERDGPPIVPPTHQGFGRILIERAAAQEFGAQPTIDYAPEGLSYEIDAPLSAVTVPAGVGGRS